MLPFLILGFFTVLTGIRAAFLLNEPTQRNVGWLVAAGLPTAILLVASVESVPGV